MQPGSHNAILASLRSELARLERHAGAGPRGPCLRFGLPAIDRALPGGGIAAGALHEFAGAGAQTEHATAPALLAAALLAQPPGTVLWVMERPDIHPPALAAVGLAPDRVVYVHARRPRTVLLVMEEGLRHRGLAGVVGELGGRLSLTASRRLQLAAGRSGVTAILLRRSHRFDDPALRQPSAAVTRWRIAAVPSAPPLAHASETPGLGRARWRLDLVRCRGGVPRSWVLEACDATGRCGLVPDMADRPAAPERSRQGTDQGTGRAAA